MELKNAVITIAILFLIILTLIFLVRLFFRVTLFFLVRKYKHYKEKFPLKRKKEFFAKEDDELLKDKVKEEEKFRVLETMDGLTESEKDKIKEGIKDQIEEGKIVGIAKPIGFWTSLILGEKLTFLVNQAHALNKDHKGFWVSLVQAQSRTRDRQKSRSR